jgi:ATP-dependent Clp protease protease subunit
MFDVYSWLLRDRSVFVNGAIEDDMAGLVVARLLFLEAEDPDRKISLYINSPGGSVSAALGNYDTMQYVPGARVAGIGLVCDFPFVLG